MSWQNSLKILNDEEIGRNLAHLDSRTSSVTTSWGVDWSETYIARDLMQNFFDANRERLTQVRVLVEGTKVTISGPAKFELARLFYLGSEKGDGDIGQYGEGFKAAAVCLLRDHSIEPIAVSGDQVVYLRVDSQKICGTELQPVIYDFFRSSEVCDGARLILRGCSKNLIRALEAGLTHFFFDQYPLLGDELWSSRDGHFAVFVSKTNSGHVFYRRLKRGWIPDIPVVLVINKNFERIEKKIKSDRDRNAFGDALMGVFYQIFARNGVKGNCEGQKVIVAAARDCWVRGHPLLHEISEAGYNNNRWPSSGPLPCSRALTQVPRLRSPPVLLSGGSTLLRGTPTTPAARAGSVGSPPCPTGCGADTPLEFSRLTLSALPVLSPSLTPPRSCAAA